MKNIQIITIILFFILKIQFLIAQNYPQYFQNIGAEKGLSQNTVYDILQDHQGFMWFCTQDGLNKFDGYTFTVYGYDAQLNSLSDDYLWSLYEDKNGMLWIGTDAGGLNKFDRTTETFTAYMTNKNNPKSIQSNLIYSMLEDSKHRFWVGTGGAGLAKMNRKTGEFQHFLPHATIYKLLENKDGKIWVGTDQGLYLFSPDDNQFDLISGFEHEQIHTLALDDAQQLWVGTKNNLKLYHLEHQTITTILEHHDIADVLFFKNQIWIATARNGLKIYDLQTQYFQEYHTDKANLKSIGNDDLCKIYQDRTGGIWIGTRGAGISFFDYKAEKFKTYRHEPNQENSLTNNDIRAFVCDKNQNVWVGTLGGGLNKLDEKTGKFTPYTYTPDCQNCVSGNRIRAVFEDKNGILWIGTQGYGLNRFDPKTETFTQFYYDAADSLSLPSNHVWTMAEDSEGNLWVGTRGGGIAKLDEKNGQFERFANKQNNPNSLINNKVKILYFDTQGFLWIGTSGGGVDKFDPKTQQFTHYSSQRNDPKSLSNNFVNCIYQDQKKRLWIGTFGGLNLLHSDGKTFTHFQEKDGLPNDVIYGILEDEKDNLWMSTNRGLAKFNPDKQTVRKYGRHDGLQGEEFNTGAFFQDKNGRMYFGGIDGFNIFDPKKLTDNPFAPNVEFTGLEIFNQPVKYGQNSVLKTVISYQDELVLDYSDYVFTLRFSGLSFTNSEQNQYAYFLEGFDKDWQFVGNRQFATYTNLSGGDYIFKVKCANHDGTWGEAKSLKIKIIPPFWQTNIFIGSSIIFGIFLMYIVYYLRIKQLEKRRLFLEAEVQKQTAEIRTQNEELEQQSEEIMAQKDHIEQQQNNLLEIHEQLTKSIEYAQKIQQSILPSKKQLSDFEDYYIIYRPRDMVSGDFFQMYKTEKYTFVIVADCTGHGVPGAFMSMIGAMALHEIIMKSYIESPAEILIELHKNIRTILAQQEKGSTSDGMDISICRIEKLKTQKYHLVFGLAKQRIWVSDKELFEIKGNIYGIGGRKAFDQISFDNQEVTINKKAKIYLFTDGFIDQNDKTRERFGTRRMRELMQENHQKSIREQGILLENALDSYRGQEAQRDDITFLMLEL